jgi:hypothetical protein
VTVDHVAKDRDHRGDWAVGAGHKKAIVDGAMLAFEIVHPFGRGRSGLVKILVFKDRPGALRGQAVGKEIARLQLTANAEGDEISYSLQPPAGDQVGADGFRPTVLMERISRFLEGMEQPLSAYAIRNAVPGKLEGKLIALRVLAAEGYLQCQPGQRGGLLYRSQKPFREAGIVTGSRTVPNLFPEQVKHDLFPVPHPYRGEQDRTGQSGTNDSVTCSPTVAGPNGAREMAYAELADEQLFVDALHEVEP